MTFTPIVNAPSFYVNDLVMAYFTGTQVAVGPGMARDSTNTNDLSIALPTLISINVNGFNALDTGTVANNTYYAVLMIGDSSDFHPTGFLLTASPLAPTLPFGYDIFRRIGWVRTDGFAAILPFTQYGIGQYRKYYYLPALTLLTGGTATTFATGGINLTSLALVPPFHLYTSSIMSLGTRGATEIMVGATYTPASATNTAQFAVQNGASTPIVAFGTGVAGAQVDELTLPTITGAPSTGFNYKVFAGDTLSLTLISYTDPLY